MVQLEGFDVQTDELATSKTSCCVKANVKPFDLKICQPGIVCRENIVSSCGHFCKETLYLSRMVGEETILPEVLYNWYYGDRYLYYDKMCTL